MPVLYLPIYVPSQGEAPPHGQQPGGTAFPTPMVGPGVNHTSPGAPGSGPGTPLRPLYLPADCNQSPVGPVGGNPRPGSAFYPPPPPFSGFMSGAQNPRIFSTASDVPRNLTSAFSLEGDRGDEGGRGGKEEKDINGLDDVPGGGLGHESNNNEKNRLLKYKTQLCRWHLSLSYCPHGVNCLFAHGLGELREVRSHSLYKTKPCRNYHLLGACAYADKCRYYHDGGEKRNPVHDRSHRLSESASTNAGEIMGTELLKRDCEVDDSKPPSGYPCDMIGPV